jgi:phospholipase C
MKPDVTQTGIPRRTLVKGATALGAAALLGPAFAARAQAAAPRQAAALTPIRHIVICAEENRSFDHYYGFAPWVGSYGVPAGYTQPDGNGGTVAPYHFTELSTSDVPHSWSAMHSEYDGGPVGRHGQYGRTRPDGVRRSNSYRAVRDVILLLFLPRLGICV